MPFIKTDLSDLLIYSPKVWEDHRGYFYESYNKNEFTEAGLVVDFVQDNQASSGFGVIRGLHYQMEPYAQTKLIRVLSGRILDVVVDIRKSSKTFGKVFTIELSASNRRQLLVPKGFAHGYSVLSETSEVFYKCDAFYKKESEAGIAYNDHELNINWGIPPGKEIISEKDKNYPALNKF